VYCSPKLSIVCVPYFNTCQKHARHALPPSASLTRGSPLCLHRVASNERVSHYPSNIASYTEWQPVGRTTGSDPRINIVGAPIIGGERIGPLAVLSEDPGKRNTPEQPDLQKVE